jgi:putative membrane protein
MQLMNDDAIYPGIDGFLGTRASLMLDVLVLAMLVVVAVLCWSVYQVKYRRRYSLHKRTQICLGVALLIVVVLFEVDVRLHGWETRAAGPNESAPAIVWYSLYFHLIFAVSSLILWPVTIVLALRNFPNPPHPAVHSRVHIPLARIAAADMIITAFTGWTFYYLAFVR